MTLYEKYNVPVPRYTSYPTVPYWENNLTEEGWKLKVKETFDKTNSSDGISLYIHLPFCESLCTYCACNTRITKNHSVEKTYADALIKEWKIYLDLFQQNKPRIKELHLGGGTPTFFSPPNLHYLLREILSCSEICADHDFSFEAHPANTTQEHLAVLNSLGFKRLSLGIQDFDLKVQKAIHRFQDFEMVKTITASARQNNYTSVNFDLIYGLPFQTEETIANTIEQVVQLKPDRIAFYSYAHVPWLRPGQRGYSEEDLPNGEQKRKLYETGKKILTENGYYEIGMDHFALKNDELFIAQKEKKLHRNFMGYTSRHTKLLIGLGASSISDAFTAFAQNEKKAEDYYQSINKGHLPIHKGHILSAEDSYLRKCIGSIMCNHELTFTGEQKQVTGKALERLMPLMSDGLVDFIRSGIKVTKKGKPFVRNIAFCFDEKYWNKIPDAKTFSGAI